MIHIIMWTRGNATSVNEVNVWTIRKGGMIFLGDVDKHCEKKSECA